MEEEKKKAEQARKQLKSKPATAMVTRSQARKLPSSSSESDSESESLDLEKIMDDGVLHNTDAPNTAEDIMQKPNGNDVTDSTSQNILQEDKANDTDGIASTSQNIVQDDGGNDKAANSHSHSVRKTNMKTRQKVIILCRKPLQRIALKHRSRILTVMTICHLQLLHQKARGNLRAKKDWLFAEAKSNP